MLISMYPFWAGVISLAVAQLSKPFFNLIIYKRWDRRLIFASGSFPSSHTSTVTALTLSVGLKEHFSSTLFAVTLVFSLIIAYDAMNVRYYSGKNIEITQKLIDDLKEVTVINLDDPIYQTRMKAVLGHKLTEVLGGISVGILVSSVLYLIIAR